MGYARTDDEIQNVLDHRVVYQRDAHGRMHQRPIITSEERTSVLGVDTGWTIELVAGAFGGAVAIAAIAGVAPLWLAAIATIAVSLALLAQGSTIAARWQHAEHIAGSEQTEAVGISTEVFGGLAGFALGTLALIDVEPAVLLPAAAIVIGASLVLGGPAQPELADGRGPSTSSARWRVTRRGSRTSGGAMVMAGLAAITLGVLPLAAGGPVFLMCAIAMLCVGAALVLAGVTLFARRDKTRRCSIW